MNVEPFACVSTKCEAQTQVLGRCLGERMQGGETVCLIGEIGSGKTVFARGMALGLGIVEPITSPSFTLLNVYEGRLPFYHFDAYRVHAGHFELDTGFDDYIERQGVVVIEWADLLQNRLPKNRLEIIMSRDYMADEQVRNMKFFIYGNRLKSIEQAVINAILDCRRDCSTEKETDE